MTIETELKLSIAPGLMARLKRHSFLRSLSTQRATTRILYSIYFDTPDLKLHQAAMALRLRRSGKQWLQTLKGGGEVRAGLHQRNEWEAPVTGEQLDFAALEALGAVPLPPSLRKKIQPIFITDFTRSIRLVKFEGALIEIGLDSGEVRAGKSGRIISEVELELKSGNPLQLYRLALALLDIVPLEIETTSKAEYGYHLRNPVKASASKAKALQLSLNMAVSEALQTMIWSCLAHLQANVSGVTEGKDEEYLHQVRVALRRLRVVLSMAAKHQSEVELDALRSMTSDLSAALGRSREWDVFVTQTLTLLEGHPDESADIKTIVCRSEELRQYHQHIVKVTVQNGEIQRLLLRFGAWMHGAYWRATDSTETISSFAVKILQKRSLRVKQQGDCLRQEADASQLHSLRIACKNLRYSADMLSSLYAQEKTKPYLEILAKLQDILGSLNDNAVALRLVEELDEGTHNAAIPWVCTKIKHGNSRLLIELRKAWKKFSSQTDFWH